MAQERVFGDAPRQTALERIHIIDAFADVAPLAKQILVHIGDGQCVQIEAAIARKEAGEEGAVGTGGLNLGARLQNGVARNHFARLGIELGVVERVR